MARIKGVLHPHAMGHRNPHSYHSHVVTVWRRWRDVYTGHITTTEERMHFRAVFRNFATLGRRAKVFKGMSLQPDGRLVMRRRDARLVGIRVDLLDGVWLSASSSLRGGWDNTQLHVPGGRGRQCSLTRLETYRLLSAGAVFWGLIKPQTLVGPALVRALAAFGDNRQFAGLLGQPATSPTCSVWSGSMPVPSPSSSSSSSPGPSFPAQRSPLPFAPPQRAARFSEAIKLSEHSDT